ncbi:hypothetical protein M9H77_11955 [Catharanthus roseus]|uniref:Uncharacterized protein n=1 Tax=Catharanthus roseus TaxID=4058 RepID=A0ACC0BG50_CATRO|nr:hypothetical protein M9H77_11955 [Catharanthus roseus]
MKNNLGQPIRVLLNAKPRRSLALGLDNCALSPLAKTKYSSSHSTSTTTSFAAPVSPSIRPPMEDIDEGFEEGSEGEHNAEGRSSSGSDLEVVRMTPGTGRGQGRKRMRAALKGASSSNISAKKARAITPPPYAPL